MRPYRIRQAKPFRTRIQFERFRGQPRCCNFMTEKLAGFPGVMHVEVRPKTGSVILAHPDTPVSVSEVVEMVTGLARRLDALEVTTGASSATACSPAPGQGDLPGHRSGIALVFSGIYLGSLIFRRLIALQPPAMTWVRGLISFPFILALYLAWPVQKEAVTRFQETRELDLGMISAGLLGLSFLTGNILTALIIAWLFNLSAWLETRIKHRTRRTIRQMLAGDIHKVWQIVNGAEIQRDIDDIRPGDILVLQEGDMVPVDGVITKGQGLVNEAAMTGEGLSVFKTKKDRVLAGTALERGQFQVRVEKTGRDTRLSAIIGLIETAETDSGELGRLGQQMSRAMLPVSLTIAAGAFVLTGNFLQAVTLIMITCPCALRLSSSVAVSVAMGQAASDGILFKGGSHVEAAGQVNVLALDKTGTLTEDRARVSRVAVTDRRFAENTILCHAAAAMKTVPHPLSRAVVDEARLRDLTLPRVKTRQRFTGKGVSATVGTRRVHAGSPAFLAECGIDTGRGEMMPRGYSQVYVALENHLTGCILIASKNREDTSRESILRLRQAGIQHIALLTGDGSGAGSGLKAALGLDEVKRQVSPEDKAAWVAARKIGGDRVAVAGDGINDTPAFARSDLSIAVGDGGADAAIEYADVVLQQGGISGVARTVEIGRDTVTRIRESYLAAVSLNLIALGLTATGIITPLAGALVHNLVTACAVANAARIPASRTEASSPRKSNLSPGLGIPENEEVK